MAYRVAVVEDDPVLRENYTDLFSSRGYQVSAYPDRHAAQAMFQSRLPDLAIIDIGLGNEVDGGFALCQWLRARSETLPIIFLSARDNDYDIVSGLRLGADDYLTKDISLPHLTARVAALFRRIEVMNSTSASATPEERVEHGYLVLDGQRLTCTWRDIPVNLTVTEFWMVYALARDPGHVRSRDQLMQQSRLVVDDATITSHVKRIRKKFVATDPAFDRIETVYGMGYRWLDTA